MHRVLPDVHSRGGWGGCHETNVNSISSMHFMLVCVADVHVLYIRVVSHSRVP